MAKDKFSAMPYRPCVGAMVLNSEGLVWIGRRVNDVNSEVTPDMLQLWQMPQGGIDKKEDPLKAAERELYEETGIRSISLLAEAPDWINYDLPEGKIGIALKGKYRGQTQRWFAFDIKKDSMEPTPDGIEFQDWKWVSTKWILRKVVGWRRPPYVQVLGDGPDAGFGRLRRR